MSKRFQSAATVRATSHAVAVRERYPNLHMRPSDGESHATAPQTVCGVAVASLLPQEYTSQWPIVGCAACLAAMPALVEVSDGPDMSSLAVPAR